MRAKYSIGRRKPWFFLRPPFKYPLLSTNFWQVPLSSCFLVIPKMSLLMHLTNRQNEALSRHGSASWSLPCTILQYCSWPYASLSLTRLWKLFIQLRDFHFFIYYCHISHIHIMKLMLTLFNSKLRPKSSRLWNTWDMVDFTWGRLFLDRSGPTKLKSGITV